MSPNKIDDIFKEGLEGYSEEVSKGVWKKISGGLLRHEISHFNFTNIPKLWVGMAAAGIVAIFVAVYQLTPVPPVPQVQERNITLTEEKSSDEGFILPNRQNPTQAQIDDVLPAKDQSDNILHPENSKLQANDREIVIIDKPGTYPANNNSPARPNSDRNNMVMAENSSSEELSFLSPLTAEGKLQTQPTDIGTESIDETGEISLEGPLVVASDKPNDEQTVLSKETADQAVSTTLHQEATTLESHTTGIAQSETRDAGMKHQRTQPVSDEIHSATRPDLAVTPLAVRKSETGKIQRMHTLSYSFGQFFKGKYKPPKRRFSENSFSKFRGNKPYFSLSAYFAPELTTYTRISSTSREMSYLAGVAVSYNSTRFVLEGAVEVSHSYDQGDYLVDMDTYDSIGWYQSVGGFIPDPNNPDSLIFDTQPVSVYDSIQHNDYHQTQNQYTYLQFPLMIGYQAMDRGVFSAYIKAGPSFSFLLNKKEPPLDYFNPDATINQIENYTPTRMSTSIQILVSVALKFQLTEKFGILVEPTYRYFVKSVYNDKNYALKNPYSFGIRTGLFLDL